MDNQHRMITGYRELSRREIDLINTVKLQGEALNTLVAHCRAVDVEEGKNGDATHDAKLDEASRWRAIAATHFQQGLMALTRSISKPETFA